MGNKVIEFKLNLNLKKNENIESEYDIKKQIGFSGFGKFSKISDKEIVKEKSIVVEKQLNFKARKFDINDFIKPITGTEIENLGEKNEEKKNEKFEENYKILEEEKEIEESEKEEYKQEEDEEEEYEENDTNNEDIRYKRIFSNQIELCHGNKTVSAIALDPNGKRLVTGSLDYEVRFWDFQKMDSTFQSFRTIEPCECHPIKHLDYSDSEELILVIGGNCQAKIVDKDGFTKFECPKGDMYIRDLNNTKGHIAMLNYGCWNQRDSTEFITCSNDGTIRIWNLKSSFIAQQKVIKVKSKNGLKAIPTTVNFSRDYKYLFGCADNSTIFVWDHQRKAYINPSFSLIDTHEKGCEITSLSFSYSGNLFSTRDNNETMKLWDLRNYKKPLFEFKNLFNRYSFTNCSFSPDDKLIFTGTSLEKNDKEGKLKFFNTTDFSLKYEISIEDTSIVKSLWHPKLNQILIGCSNGLVKIFYDDDLSLLGAKLCLTKSNKIKNTSFTTFKPQILTPHALPMFKQNKKKSKIIQDLKDRKDPIKSRRPESPITGQGQGGRLASVGSTYSSFIARNLAIKNRLIDDKECPRKALLKHAKAAEENPYWVAPAYQKTQPKTIYQKVEIFDNSEEPSKKKKVK